MIYIIYIIIILFPLAFGSGAARLTHWVLGYIRERLPANQFIRNVTTVLGWIVGSGSLYGAIRGVDLRPLGIPGANAIATLSYLGGLGLGFLWIDRWDRGTLIWEMHEFLSLSELDAVLLVSRYGLNPNEAASRLNMSETDFEETFKTALLKIENRGQRLLDSIRHQAKNKQPLEKKELLADGFLTEKEGRKLNNKLNRRRLEAGGGSVSRRRNTEASRVSPSSSSCFKRALQISGNVS